MTGLFWTLSLALSDMAFLEKWASALKPESLPRGPTRFLMHSLLEHWESHRQLLDWPAYVYYVDHAIDDEDLHEDYRQVFLDLGAAYSITQSSMPTAWKAAEEWIQNYHVGMALDRARTALTAGDRDTAFSELLGLREVTGEVREEPVEITPNDSLGGLVSTGKQSFRQAIPLGLDLFDEALEGGIYPDDLAIVAGPTNLGKALCPTTPISTPYGWKSLGQVEVGEEIFAPDGSVTRVIGKSPRWQSRPRYRVIFQDGEQIIADAEHEWVVRRRWDGKYKKCTTEQLAGARRHTWAVDVSQSLRLPEAELLLDPYVLGVWLGDGSTATGQLTLGDEEIINEIRGVFSVHKSTCKTAPYLYNVVGLPPVLRQMGLLGHKTIPRAYLRSSRQQRLALLQGIMDTDGTISITGNCELPLKERGLVNQVRELVHSLGIRTTLTVNDARLYGKDCGKRYRLKFSTTECVFRLPRKRARIPSKVSSRQQRRYIRTVEILEPGETVCIQVAHPSHQFLAGWSMIPTCNSMFLCYLAASAYKANRRILYLTYELSRHTIGERILTALFESSKHDLNPATVADELMSLRKRWGVTGRGSVVIEDGMQTVAQLRRRLEEDSFDLVLLDSADDMVPRQTYPSLYLSQGEVYSDILLDICHGLHIPVWTSVQLNREGVEKARVNLRHIGDSFKKVQRSTLCLGISQSREEEDFYVGPLVKINVLKDTQHGAKGNWWRFITKFGRGSKGWPGFVYWPERGDLT